METDSALDEYMESAAYLPEFMRDFHDAKTIFKCIEDGIVKHRLGN